MLLPRRDRLAKKDARKCACREPARKVAQPSRLKNGAGDATSTSHYCYTCQPGIFTYAGCETSPKADMEKPDRLTNLVGWDIRNALGRCPYGCSMRCNDNWWTSFADIKVKYSKLLLFFVDYYRYLQVLGLLLVALSCSNLVLGVSH